ncbi:MAG: 6-pyruvoyl-tetrahydropterin synthase-related protein [Candidatus Levybacteria bacterium]|nr:6-pyruvoyl-tetrahydropterin synthase-related protein [Candidatus Levybacteria bacterium]
MRYKSNVLFFTLLIISVIPLFDLLKPGLPLTHDGQDHVARIANFYQNLSEGVFVPRWAGNLNWGYGHPILEFLYPLPSYFASLFHFLGFSLVDATKLVFGDSFVLSAPAMYIFVRELLKDEKAALLAGLLYVIAPYRLVDLYVRGAIGEHVAFIFPPLIFYFLLRLSKRYSVWYLIGGGLSFAALNLSHNAISLMFIPLFGAYAAFLFLHSKNKVKLVIAYLVTILLGFGLSAFFWIPAFMEGKYTLRDIVTGGGEYKSGFVAVKDFFFGQWNYGGTLTLSKQIGMIQWIGIFAGVVSAYFLHKNKNKLWIVSLGSLVVLGATLFLMTETSDLIWRSVSILQKFQFPWRLLSLTVFLSALLGAIAFHSLINKPKRIILLIIVVGLLIANKDYWHANGFLSKPESFFTQIYNGTTDTGESAPIWSIRFMEKRPKSRIEIIEGAGEIKEKERNFTKHRYEIIAFEKSRILENTLYFPGWTVLVNGKNSDIQFQDPNYRGLITFYLNKGKHNIEIIYAETRVRQTANMVSVISLLIIGSLVFGSISKKIV